MNGSVLETVRTEMTCDDEYLKFEHRRLSLTLLTIEQHANHINVVMSMTMTEQQKSLSEK